MTSWTDETLPSTSWGSDLLLINATDVLLVGDAAGEHIVIGEESGAGA
jgi:hypothetical protein